VFFLFLDGLSFCLISEINASHPSCRIAHVSEANSLSALTK